MARLTAAALLPLALLGAAFAHEGQNVAAVQKVIQMLTDMSATTKKEKQAEEVAYAQFSTWCSMESASLQEELSKNGAAVESLSAEVGKLSSDIFSLGEDVAALQQQVASHDADKKAETLQREKDHEAFVGESTDFSESVDAIERAIAILKKEDYDRPASAAALLQVSEGEHLPAKARSIVAAFLGMLNGAASKETPLGGMDYSAPEANAYEFQSTSIVEMLKRLQDEFRSKLSESQKEEANSKHAFSLIVQDLTDSIENMEREASEKSAEKQRKTSKKAKAEAELARTQDLKADNEKTLKEVTAECYEKKLSFAEKQKLRSEEMDAIAKAIEILSSPDVMGNAEKHLSLAQAPHAGAGKAAKMLLQISDRDSAEERSQGIRRKIRDFLEGEGSRLKSPSITLLAEKIGADPFSKVKKLIDALITRLLEEAKVDADHEGFCDTELGQSKVTRTKLSEDIDALSAAVEDGKATILKLTADIAELTKQVAALDRAMAEATSMRVAEKKKNGETVSDAKSAQQALSAATQVLKDYYEKAATATALIQVGKGPEQPRRWGLKMDVKMGSEEWNSLANPNFKGTVDTGHKEGMQTFGETEYGKQDEAKYGVMALLEVLASDFATLQAQTEAAEAQAAEAYDRFMAEARKNKAAKMKKLELDSSDKASAEAKLQTDTADMKATQDELLAANRYYDKLVPQCIDRGMTFQERAAARQAELSSLKEALKILESPDVA